MPRKIKILWVACILTIFFGFVYFSFVEKVEVYKKKEEARVQQESRVKKKQKEAKAVDKGQVFKTDPIKEIKELNALGKYEEAVKYAEGAATLNPDQPRIYTWWGISLVKSGKRKEGIGCQYGSLSAFSGFLYCDFYGIDTAHLASPCSQQSPVVGNGDSI